MAIQGIFKINGHDYTPYVKQKTGFGWARENTNDKDAGRDEAETMHTNVTSHQRKLTMKLGPAEEQFREDGIILDNVNFTLISVKEATV